MPTPTPAPAVTTAPTPSAPTPTPSATATPPASPTPTIPPSAAIAAELMAPGSLTACLSVIGAPAAALDESGALVGYNVSFAQEIASRLDLDLQTRSPLFDDLIQTIERHECDLSISSQNITADRLAQVDFAAYTESLQPVLVAIGNPNGIDSLDDLCGLAVSATTGTTHIDLVNGTGEYVGEGLNDGCVAAGRPKIDLHTYETESHAVTALLSGQVVAYMGNPSFAFDFRDQIQYSTATRPPAPQGITTARDRPALGAAIEAALAAMMADGSYRAILIQHLPNDESVRLVSILE
jgi:polar amino acid transport system substrate-binding protein